MFDSTQPSSPEPESTSTDKTRRSFIAATGFTAFGFSIVPRHVLGGPGYIPPSEQVQMAGIGAGGMGGGDIATFTKLGANFVALCDVDDQRAAGTFGAHPKARRYKDFREMLDKEAANIDAVSVGTPDHVHAVASMAAIKAGKHVYCQKPLTHTLFECRELTETVLLGVLALRVPGRRLMWDAANLKVANIPDVNQYVHTEYRKGWSL